MSDGPGSETYTYDAGGRVTHLAKVIDSVTYGMDYTYNAAGEPLTVAYPSSATPKLASTYDAIGRLCSVGPSGSTCSTSTDYAKAFTYGALGQQTGFTLGNGVVASMGYSADRLQMTSLAYTKGSATLLSLNYLYAYDSANCATGTGIHSNNGQIQCINDVTDSPGTGRTGRSASYSYDELGRLNLAQTTGSSGTGGYSQWKLTWDYDRYGNRKDQTVVIGTGVPANSLTFADPGGAHTNHPDGFSFDANGNMLGDGLNTLTYDAENQTTNAMQGGTSVADYVYDGNGLRVKKCVPSCTSPTTITRYIYYGPERDR